MQLSKSKTKSISYVWLCLLVLGFIVGGNLMANDETQKNIFILTDEDETHIRVKSQEQFSLKIESNPTTGYSWSMQKLNEKNDSLVKLIEQKVEEPMDRPDKERRLGAPTYEVFTFEALSPGEASIELHYRRPWEKDVPPLKKQKIAVTID